MFSFGKKKEKEVPAAGPEEARIDFVVHNMPDPKNLSAPSLEHVRYSNLSEAPAATAGKHQSIGAFIIIGGVILIAGVVYGAYYFVIKPYAKAPANAVPAPAAQVESQASSTPVQSEPAFSGLASSTEIATTTSEASSTIAATSTMSATSTAAATSTVATTTVDIDTDGDGLSDKEELFLGTNANNPDTDGDGFGDLSELQQGYDPLRPSAKLGSSSPVMLYNFNKEATIAYAGSWSAVENSAKDTVVFSNGEKSFIQLSVQANDKKMNDIVSWFQSEFVGLVPGGMVSGKNWTGIYSPDKLTLYLMSAKNSKIYTLSYSPLTDNSASLDLFHTMIKSLVIK